MKIETNVNLKNNSPVVSILSKNVVPLFFLVICILGIWAADLNLKFLVGEIITRLARNSFLVLSLLIPVTAGMGLNFGIVLGAMAGQSAIIAITHYGITGLQGFLLACLVATPIAIIVGYLAGMVLNRAKGREMITSMILGYFANGVYQLIFLFLVGSLIPMNNRRMMLPGGVGLRNTVDIYKTSNTLNKIILLKFDTIKIPVVTLLVVLGLCIMIYFLLKTKLGQQLRAVGQDLHIAEVAGIPVNKVRIIAVIFSTVFAAWGQLIFLQDISTLNTYNSHEQVGMFAIAALLVGGATTKRATIWNALVGVLLFHTLFVVSPLAGQKLVGIPMIGEYFRVFIAYGVIGIALALHAWQSKKKKTG